MHFGVFWILFSYHLAIKHGERAWELPVTIYQLELSFLIVDNLNYFV